MPVAKPLTLENANGIWQQALTLVSPMLADHAANATRITAAGPNQLAVAFPRQYNFHKTCCERVDSLNQLEQALAQLTGGRVKIELAVLADEDGPSPRPPEPKRPTSSRQRLLEKSQHPLVKRTTELFNAPAVRVEEPEERP